MEGEILNIIEGKLESNNLPKFETLSEKQKERINKLELFINENKKKCTSLIGEMKCLRLTKVNIANSNKVGLSRKTLYNDKILLRYIEISISEQDDYFNENKLTKLQKDFNNLKNQYDKLLENIIDNNSVKYKIKKCEEELMQLNIENENLKKINIELQSRNTSIINYPKTIK